MKTVNEMALEAWGADHEIFWFDDDGIERFAALVRADERDRAMRENAYVAAEREACAKVCEDSVEYAGDTLAQAIRARGNTCQK